MSKSMLKLMLERLISLQNDALKLLEFHSGLRARNEQGHPFFVLSPSGDHHWTELTIEGKRLQTRILPKVKQLSELILVLTKNLPKPKQSELKSQIKQIQRAIEQDGASLEATTDAACERFKGVVNAVSNILEEHFGCTDEEVIAIPDTNALLMRPDIERWNFGDKEFTVLLTPTVLSELDSHKINHRNEKVRDKAGKLVRRIKEFRRRGNLTEGVPCVSGKIHVKAVAPEPVMDDSLSWFDKNNNDDKFLASVIEIIRDHLSAECFIVTYDINMQNKSEFAGIPYRELSETDEASPG